MTSSHNPILESFNNYINQWKLCTSEKEEDDIPDNKPKLHFLVDCIPKTVTKTDYGTRLDFSWEPKTYEHLSGYFTSSDSCKGFVTFLCLLCARIQADHHEKFVKAFGECLSITDFNIHGQFLRHKYSFFQLIMTIIALAFHDSYYCYHVSSICISAMVITQYYCISDQYQLRSSLFYMIWLIWIVILFSNMQSVFICLLALIAVILFADQDNKAKEHEAVEQAINVWFQEHILVPQREISLKLTPAFYKNSNQELEQREIRMSERHLNKSYPFQLTVTFNRPLLFDAKCFHCACDIKTKTAPRDGICNLCPLCEQQHEYEVL